MRIWNNTYTCPFILLMNSISISTYCVTLSNEREPRCCSEYGKSEACELCSTILFANCRAKVQGQPAAKQRQQASSVTAISHHIPPGDEHANISQPLHNSTWQTRRASRIATASSPSSPVLSYFLGQPVAAKPNSNTFPFKRGFGAPLVPEGRSHQIIEHEIMELTVSQ